MGARLMRLLALMLAVFLQLFAGASAAERITDILGRSIDLADPPQRVVLGDSLDFIFLSLLLDDPAAPIVGWAGADRIAASLLPLDRRRFPELDRIASLGDPNAGGFSVEAALALEPDVAVLGPGYTPDDNVVRQLERAGVAVVFIGAASDTVSRGRREITGSMRILGEMFGKADRAGAFTRFYDERMDRIEALVADRALSPSVLVEAHANSADCCWSPGSTSNYVAFAGGRNIADGNTRRLARPHFGLLAKCKRFAVLERCQGQAL
jgi:iron complex transport system substrate-binding protein